MVEKQFADRKTPDQHTFGDDRYWIDLQILAGDDEGCFQAELSQYGVVKKLFLLWHLIFVIC